MISLWVPCDLQRLTLLFFSFVFRCYTFVFRTYSFVQSLQFYRHLHFVFPVQYCSSYDKEPTANDSLRKLQFHNQNKMFCYYLDKLISCHQGMTDLHVTGGKVLPTQLPIYDWYTGHCAQSHAKNPHILATISPLLQVKRGRKIVLRFALQ